MAAENTLQDFLVSIVYSTDEAGRKKMLSGIEAVQKRAAEATIVLERFALSFLSFEAAKGAIETVGSLAAQFENLFYAARRTGSSAGELRAFSYAVSQLGGSAEGAMQSLEALASKIRSNPAGYGGYLKRFGISDPSNVAKTAEQMRQSLKAMPYWKALQYAQSLGLDENTLRAVIDPDLDKFLTEYRAKMRAAGLDPDAAANNGRRLAQEWRSLSASLDVLVQKALAKLFPEADDPLKKLTDWIDTHSEKITDVIDTIAKAIIDLAKSVASFVQTDTFKKFIENFTDPDNWKRFATTLGEIGREIEAIFKRIDGFFKSPAGRFVLGKWGLGVTDEGASTMLPPQSEVAPDANSGDPFGAFGAVKRGYDWAKKKLGLGGAGTPAPAPTTPGTYRPQYNLTKNDLSEAVVRKVAGEAMANDANSIDAVVNNMMNRVGTSTYGPSGNLQEVAYAPGQYTGYRVPSAKEAELIRSRIRAIAAGAVPDNTNGSNEYRASSYYGPWYRAHADAPVVGGNRFAYNPGGGRGPYGAYPPRKLPPMVRSDKPIVPYIKPLPGTVNSPFGTFDPDALRKSLNMQTPAGVGATSMNNTSNHATQNVSVNVHGASDPQKTSMAIERVLNRQKIFLQRNAQSAIG